MNMKGVRERNEQDTEGQTVQGVNMQSKHFNLSREEKITRALEEGIKRYRPMATMLQLGMYTKF